MRLEPLLLFTLINIIFSSPLERKDRSVSGTSDRPNYFTVLR